MNHENVFKEGGIGGMLSLTKETCKGAGRKGIFDSIRGMVFRIYYYIKE